MKTYSMKPADIEKKWYVVDAEDLVLGRMASVIANRLRGKHKPGYTPHVDCGDNIIVVNAEKVVLTGKKFTDKVYYRHTGHPGGIKEITPDKLKEKNKSEDIIKKAIKGMLPNSPLFRDLMKNNLKLYKDSNHPHESQNPKTIDFKSQNRKNLINV